MTDIFNENTVTGNGEFAFEQVSPAAEVLLEWCIVSGTATVTPGYVALDGAFSPALGVDGASPSFGPRGGTCRVMVPNSGRAVLKVEDASVLDVEVPESADLEMIVCQNQIF